MSVYSKYDFDDISLESNTRRPSNDRRTSDRRPSDTRPSESSSFSYDNLSSYGNYLKLFFEYSFYFIIFILFGFVFLIVLHTLGFKTFSFLPDDGGLIPVPLLPTNRQIVFSNRLMAADASSNLVNVVQSKYTVSIDVYITSDFIDQSVPRVLLYRAANSVALTAADTTIDIIAGKMQQTDFILYLDPYTNDLMIKPIFISSGGPSGSPSISPSPIIIPPIQNVPIHKPFRITLMMSDVLLEIYINGDLQRSIPFIGNSLRAVPANTQFYGPPTIVGRSVLASNLSYWNTPLSSKSIRVYGKEPLKENVFTSS